MTLEPGANLLHYRIVEKLGEGGMGVVWKALDTTLDRTVALKVLPPSFGEDAERLARFEREAKSLAALNHPNVASLFGLHESGGARFLTMELVEGEDLAQRIERGALPDEEAVKIAIGVAEALSAAHAQGIVHRDLKPANVMLDPDGVPKVLDFGLAKTAVQDVAGSASGDPSASPTVTSLGTVAGTLLGTAAYMSPEQARGKPVDKRADTWALGCILFEMLSGRPLFKGETISDTLASVLKTEPGWDALPESTPAALGRILRRSLAKNPRDRWQDAGDLRYELERALDESPPEAANAVAVEPRRLAPLAVGLLIAGIAIGAVARHVTLPPRTSASIEKTRTVSEISTVAGASFGVLGVDLALSPDGTRLAYAAIDADGNRKLYLRTLSAGAAQELPGTEGALEPFWSPDGEEIAFHTGTHLKRMAPNDPQPRIVVEVVGASGSWNRAGVILLCSYATSDVLSVDVETGVLGNVEIDVLGSASCDSVDFLPDGEHFLVESTDAEKAGIYLARLGSPEARLLVDLKSNAVYSAGHVLYHDGPRLLARPFDTEALEFSAAPIVVADPVFETNFPFHGLFTAARDRARIVYLEGTGEPLKTEMVWFDRDGNVVERTGIVGDLYNPRLSGDGRRLLLDVSTYETEGDIWIFDLVRGSSRRLTDHPIDESQPQWSPDEQTVYFFRTPDVYAQDLRGSGSPELVHATEFEKGTSSVSPGGILAFHEHGETSSDILYYDPSTGTVTEWLAGPDNEEEAEFSPDGEWLVYQSTETGRWEIYIDSFPQRTERFRVSSDGGTNATWSADGREIFFVSPTGELVSVPMDLASESRPVGEPRVLFRPKIRRDMFEPHPDGDRFLVVTRIDPEIDHAILVDDWD